MAEQLSSPRITAPYLDSFVGRLVTIVGKVTQLRGDQATLDADGAVTVVLNRVSASATWPPPRHAALTRCAGRALDQRQRRPDHRQGEPGSVHQGAEFSGPGRWSGYVASWCTPDCAAGSPADVVADFGLCAAVVEATHRHKDVFITDG
ncbi:hypothetical protein TOPH_08654 [Tolypocladium ophioglossoides CBS 100239]|uniref:Replication factor A protein 3 n=1 Tax=Tolypocladium ophioglossoides (strain CBS 100239) TaxID=1163406 RepID=A0A0L0MY43_TOLOC|nr:hypothetical protein TOPH_08654 [Tolypocladium ophioglossoides CBS 100239]